MKKISEFYLERLYSQGKSMQQIADTLECSIHKVAYWMEKYSIKRRSRSEALYFRLNPEGNPFKIKNQLTQSELFLFGLGVGIYWGEGNKVSKHSVRVANTDHRMIKSFLQFLRVICNVEEKKIRYSLVIFNNASETKAVEFWSKQLGVTSSVFGKIVSIPPQGKGTYRRKSEFGVCTVTVSNIKLKSWLMQQIDGIVGA